MVQNCQNCQKRQEIQGLDIEQNHGSLLEAEGGHTLDYSRGRLALAFVLAP